MTPFVNKLRTQASTTAKGTIGLREQRGKLAVSERGSDLLRFGDSGTVNGHLKPSSAAYRLYGRGYRDGQDSCLVA